MLRRGRWRPAVALGLGCVFAVAAASVPALAQQGKAARRGTSNGNGGSGRAAAAPAPTDRAGRERLFLDGLRGRGYDDLAAEYADALRKDAALPEPFRAELSLEVARDVVGAAAGQGDLAARARELDAARATLDDLVASAGDGPLGGPIRAQRARLDVERGHAAALRGDAVTLADEQGKPVPAAAAARDSFLADARAAFAAARTSYDAALTKLEADVAAFPGIVPPTDPRRPDYDRALNALLDASLQRALVDYREARTYPAEAKERAARLDAAIARLDDLAKNRRTRVAGTQARLLQGRCLEEKGELSQALALYDTILEQDAEALAPLVRQAAAARVGVLARRKEYPLAVDEADAWLTDYEDRRTTEEGLGVQMEMARSILAQVPGLGTDELKEQAVRAAVERLAEVARYASPHRAEAQRLLREHQGQVARRAGRVASLNYDDAMDQAVTAMGAHDWPLAESLLSQAARRAAAARNLDQLNRARYFLAYVDYATGRYYEAAARADHLARRHPGHELAPRAAAIGLAALTRSYNTFTQADRLGDLGPMAALAEHTAATWPDSNEADEARLALGQLAAGRGAFEEAAKWFEAVRENSPRRLDAQVKAGDAHARRAAALRAAGKTAEADAEAAHALAHVSDALKAREAAGTPPTDPGRIANAVALAEIHRTNGRPAEAVSVLEPIARALVEAGVGQAPAAAADASADPAAAPTPGPGPGAGAGSPLHAQALAALVRAHLDAGQPDRAIAAMTSLEKLDPGPAALASLYFELSRALKAEIEALEKANQPEKLRATQDAYRQFLRALAASPAGQTPESLQWAGEAMLDLGLPAEAADALARALEAARRDPAFNARPDAAARVLRARLRRATALRQAGDFKSARDEVRRLQDDNPRLVEPRVELGLVIEDEARAAKAADARARLWAEAFAHWKTLAGQLTRARDRQRDAFDAWYHAALALEGLGRKQEAIGTLKGVLALNPSAGGPEMKAKYQELIARLGK